MTDSFRTLISIVIPTYNHAHYLGNCLDSILKQTHQNWEAIVVNNHSEDNTAEVVSSFPDPRIRMINFRNNGVIAASRNEGIRNSRGEFIAFLDSDDLWYPEKLERCFEQLELGAELVCHGMRYVNKEGYQKDVICGPAEKAEFLNLLYNGSCIIISASVVRKECLLRVHGFDENPAIVSSEDYDLWLKLSKEKIRFHFIEEVLGEYLCHSNNFSKQTLFHLQACLTVVNNHMSSLGEYTWLNGFKSRRIKALFLYGAARSFQQKGKKQESLKFFWKSIVTFPFMLRIYIGIALNLLPTGLINKIRS